MHGVGHRRDREEGRRVVGRKETVKGNAAKTILAAFVSCPLRYVTVGLT